MSDNLVSAVLGGAAGMGRAVGSIGEKNLEALRKRLKDESLALLQSKRDERLHGQNLEIQGSRQRFEAGESKSDREAREKIASDRNAMMDKISQRESEIKKTLSSERIDANKVQMMRARVGAYAEARQILEKGGTVEMANAVLEAVGLPGLEEFEIEGTGSSGWLGTGFRAEDPEIGWRVKGSGRQQDASDLELLLAEGRKIPEGEKVVKTQAVSEEPKGMIAEAMAKQPPTSASLPKDMATWDVTLVKRNGKNVPMVLTDAGPVEITNEQYQQWRKIQYEADSSAERFIKNTKHVDYAPRTMTRPW